MGLEEGGDLTQEGEREDRAIATVIATSSSAVLNTLSIKQNESRPLRRSNPSRSGWVNHALGSRNLFALKCARRGGKNKNIRRRGSNVAPLVSPCKAGYVGQESERARSRNAPKGNETADSFEP